MWVIFLEAGAALVLFLFIVWTMFSGRNEEPPSELHADDDKTG